MKKQKKIFVSTLMAMMILAPTLAMAAGGNGIGNGIGLRDGSGNKDMNKGKMGFHIEVDEETRDEIRELKDSFMAGDITREELQEKLDELLPERLERPRKGDGQGNYYNLTDEMKANMEKWHAAFDEYKNDELTFDELKEIHQDLFPDKDVDFENMEKLMELKKDYLNGDMTKEEFFEASKDLRPEKPQFKQKKAGNFRGVELDEETKEELRDLHVKYRNGDLSREELRDALDSLRK